MSQAFAAASADEAVASANASAATAAKAQLDRSLSEAVSALLTLGSAVLRLAPPSRRHHDHGALCVALLWFADSRLGAPRPAGPQVATLKIKDQEVVNAHGVLVMVGEEHQIEAHTAATAAQTAASEAQVEVARKKTLKQASLALCLDRQ